MREVVANFFRAVGSNLLNAVVSILLTLFLPKLLDVEQYGMYQLYIFYISYASYLCFGWPDGILLRYGGMRYEELDYGMYKAQWIYYLVFIATIGLSLVFGAIINIGQGDDLDVIYLLVGIDVLIDLPKTYLRYILQTTNRIKEYAKPLVVEKICVIIMFLICWIVRADTFIIFIGIDLLGKIISLISSMYECREIVGAKPVAYSIARAEGKENVRVGVKLMLANIASMLIVGSVRFVIEKQWDVSTFGKISLTLSVSNMLMIFIRAIGLVIFPVLRRTEATRMSYIYHKLRNVLMVLLLGMLVLYYPMKSLLAIWLPQYTDALKYMAILFPICIFESKMSMLIEPYIKTYRKEKWLLYINIMVVVVSIFGAGFSAFFLNNLDLTVAMVVLLLALRCVCVEILLMRLMKLNEMKNVLWEVLLTLIFCVSGWFMTGLGAIFIYSCAYMVYIFRWRKEIVPSLHWMLEKLYSKH